MFPCMKISCTFFQHLGPQILSLLNEKNEPNGKRRNHFSCSPFIMDFVTFKIHIYPTLFKQMDYMNIAKYRCMHTYP